MDGYQFGYCFVAFSVGARRCRRLSYDRWYGKDKQNKKALENVNVSVHGSNIGTVTNAEGEFALKKKKTETPRELDISHIGYVNTHISLEKETAAMLTVWLTPHSIC